MGTARITAAATALAAAVALGISFGSGDVQAQQGRGGGFGGGRGQLEVPSMLRSQPWPDIQALPLRRSLVSKMA